MVPRYGNAVIIVALAVGFFLIPAGVIVLNLRDPALWSDGVPRCAVHWHRSLSPRYERWARERLAGGQGGNANTSDISGTEWPLFGSAFYLWATEALQDAWEKDHSLSRVAPREYARGAIDAATALVTDPGHAAWVRKHWGNDYLHNENLFYRALLIAAMTCHAKLTGADTYLPMLRDQVETLSQAIDASPHGLLNDYPGECYPTDVLGAVAIIRHADAVLGTDHSAFVRRAIRAFQGPLLDPTGLPPYSADPKTGQIEGRSRGCGNSFMLIWLPELWPDLAGMWYDAYDRHFWQHRWTADGFREFPKDVPGRDWYMDVDSGPVLAGHGFAACAFGVGAARANGRFDHAWPLTAEMLVTCWPLLDGTLAGPRILSNAVDAPYLGEAGVVFALTRRPAGPTTTPTAGGLPGFVYIILAGYVAVGVIPLILTVRGLRRWRRQAAQRRVPWPRVQVAMWAVLVAGGIVAAAVEPTRVGLLALLCAQLLPRARKTPMTAPEPAQAAKPGAPQTDIAR